MPTTQPYLLIAAAKRESDEKVYWRDNILIGDDTNSFELLWSLSEHAATRTHLYRYVSIK